MKTPTLRILSLLAVAVGLAGIGCEQHDPAVTVKGYAEKEEVQQQIDKQKSLLPEGADTTAPSYFPNQKK